MLKVELLYSAQNGSVSHFFLNLEEGATVADSINQSNIYLTHPETKSMVLGIYGKLTTLDRVLKTGDRVEIYRPLTCDPKEIRRQRARLKK